MNTPSGSAPSPAESNAVDREEHLYRPRHSATHVMAQAVQDLFPGTRLTIGPPVIRALRPDVQVIFNTGFSSAHTPSPDVELLQKPFAQETFLARVEEVLGSRGRHRAPDPIRP